MMVLKLIHVSKRVPWTSSVVWVMACHQAIAITNDGLSPIRPEEKISVKFQSQHKHFLSEHKHFLP